VLKVAHNKVGIFRLILNLTCKYKEATLRSIVKKVYCVIKEAMDSRARVLTLLCRIKLRNLIFAANKLTDRGIKVGVKDMFLKE
jgi:hypothetical protein